MKPIKDFDELLDRFRSMPHSKRVAFVCPDDVPSAEMLEYCLSNGLAKFKLVVYSGHDKDAIALAGRYPDLVEIYVASDIDSAAAKGVEFVRKGLADVLMKGNINTDNLLKAVLNRDTGILPKGNVMSHVSVTEIAGYNRLVIFSDAAVIPVPDLSQMAAMLSSDIKVADALGVSKPNVALIHFSEKVNAKFQNTLDYVSLKQQAEDGVFGQVNIDGPMDVKTACDAHSASIKGIVSPVTGNADILLFPNLEAANTFYKTISFFCKAKMAGMLTGTSAPVVIPSRADAPESKVYSLALACVMAANKKL